MLSLCSRVYSGLFPRHMTITDIRLCKTEVLIRDELLEKLQPGEGKEKKIPTILLYDEKGLKLFEAITFLDEYYLTNAEIEILNNWAGEIAKCIKPNSMVVELGSGNLRKIGILLDALDRLEQPFEYYALDLSLPELKRALSALPPYRNIKIAGLYGTYDDGLEWLKRPGNHVKPKCIVSLGSSLGNFTPTEAAEFLYGFAQILHPKRDLVLIGLDACQDAARVRKAYNDSQGTTRRFIMNGLTHANRIMEEKIFKHSDWQYVSEFDSHANRHQAFYSPTKDVIYKNISFKAGEKIRVEESYKYSLCQTAALWPQAGLVEEKKWGTTSAENPYYIHMLLPRTGGLSHLGNNKE